MVVGKLADVVKGLKILWLFFWFSLNRAVLLRFYVADGFDGNADYLSIEGRLLRNHYLCRLFSLSFVVIPFA